MKILVTAGLALASAASLAAQQAPVVRLLNLPVASSKPTLGMISNVRQLKNGSVLVNDTFKRQLLLFDANLGSATVVADSTSSGNSYGARGGGLIAYGDSTLFVDAASLSMLVIGPDGAIARIMSVPRSQDAGYLANANAGVPGFDGKGRLVYRGALRPQMPPITMGASGPNFVMPEQPDSAPILRIDMATRKTDTLAYFKIPKMKMNVTRTENGGISMTSEVNPLPLADDWAVLSDGSVAIIRGRDYHIDWVNEDGTLTSAPKVPYDWQRLSDEDKVAVIDSAKTAMERARATALANPNAPPPPGAPGGARQTIIMDGAGAALEGAARSGRGGPMGAPMAQLTFISPSELPDYRPVFTMGSARGDVDGNLWIRTTATKAGAVSRGPIYDVINKQGQVIDRVQVPAGRTIVGFGAGGVVYLQARDESGAKLEKAMLK